MKRLFDLEKLSYTDFTILTSKFMFSMYSENLEMSILGLKLPG